MIFSINQKVAIPCYTKEVFNRLKNINEDENIIFNTWEDWYESFQDIEIQLQKHGIQIKEIYIDLDELLQYCKLNNVKNTAIIRAQFALLKSGT